MIFRVFFAVIFLSLSALQGSQGDLSRPLTLPELVDIALQNNPSTKKAWWNAQRAAASVGSAQSPYYPQLDFGADISNGRTYKFVNGPQDSYTIGGANLFLNMLLYDFGGRNANLCSTRNALIAANWQSNFEIQKVMLQVLESAYQYIHAEELLKAAIVSQEEAERLLFISREMNRVGLNPISDVYTSESSLSIMKMETARQKAHLRVQMGRLLVSLGLSADGALALAPIQFMPTSYTQDLDKLIEIAHRQRADLFARQARVAEFESNLDRVYSAYGPKVRFHSMGGVNHYFHDHSGGWQYEVGLSLDMPLFNGFDTAYQNRRAYAELQLSIEEMNDLQISITMEVLSHSQTLIAVQEMLPNAEDNLNSAIKAYEGVLERYRSGKEAIVAVSNALRQLAQARVLYSDVKTRLLVSAASLAYSTGSLVPYTEIPCLKE